MILEADMVIENAIKYVKQIFADDCSGHDYHHTMQYMYLEAEVSLIGIFVLAMVVKEIIVVASYILLNHVLLRVNHQMYLNI